MGALDLLQRRIDSFVSNSYPLNGSIDMGKIKRLTGKASDFSGIVLKAAARGDLVSVKKTLPEEKPGVAESGRPTRTDNVVGSHLQRTT